MRGVRLRGPPFPDPPRPGFDELHFRWNDGLKNLCRHIFFSRLTNNLGFVVKNAQSSQCLTDFPRNFAYVTARLVGVLAPLSLLQVSAACYYFELRDFALSDEATALTGIPWSLAP